MNYPPCVTGRQFFGLTFTSFPEPLGPRQRPSRPAGAFALVLLFGGAATAAEAGTFDELRFFSESRFGSARVSAPGISEKRNAFSIGVGAQLNQIAAVRAEYMTTAEQTGSNTDWNVTSAGLQFERDAFRNGFGIYGTTDYNSVSTGSGVGGEDGSYFGFGLGARYQIDGVVRGFVDGKLQSEDFGFLSGGMRFIF